MQHKLAIYFKKETVTVEHNKQYHCYHSFDLYNKTRFNKFKRSLRSRQLDDIYDVMATARYYGIRSTAGNKPKKAPQRIIF